MQRTQNYQSSVSRCFSLCAVVLLVVVGAVSASGQTIFGHISGTGTDSSGAVIPNATVTIRNNATNLERTATTDGEGFYTVTNLPVGSYTVAVEQKGFKKAVQTDNVLAADTRLTVNITL